ncbi:MAG: carboxypeptidase-like regulatory domain-containing protein, partial [Bacteroides sp.]|nr:carboxypeptidase-like regulatory domain-containing protein [Bacteroides sp.]
MKKYITLTLTFFCLNVFSQVKLTGNIQDNNHEPVVYANVILLASNDSTFLAGCISDSQGLFTFSDLSPREAILKISCLGYTDHFLLLSLEQGIHDMDTIYLDEATTLLNEVMISARRLHVYSQGGNLITDIANSGLKSIGSAKDVLKHIPGVIATKDKYEIFGKGSPDIYVDNKKVRDINELQLVNSENILKIELITNPGAEYEAETRSVLKIITNRKKENGLSVILDGKYSQSNSFSYNEGISINYNRNGLN